jgi:hypothetical protein
MSNTFHIKRNDTSPALVRVLDAEDAGTLAGSTVRFYMARTDGSLIVDGAECTILDAADRRVAYEWTAQDTAEAGVFRAEFEEVKADGSKETFANDGYLIVTILPDLGEPS